MSPSIQTVTDQTFETAVLRSPRPVLVDYWAEHCAPCRMIAPLLEESARHFANRMTVVTLKVDENPATPSRFGVRGFPTLMIFKAGQPAAMRVGTLSRAQLHAFIEAHT